MNNMASSGNNRRRRIILTPEEISYRRTEYSDEKSITDIKLFCTVCNVGIKHRMVTDNNVHPLLEVLLCWKCKHAYENKNHSDTHSVTEYCSWCAKETELFPCNKCNFKFCKSCITRNFRISRLIFKQSEERQWECCVCAPKQIWPHRALCCAVKSYIDKTNNTLKERIAKNNSRQSTELVRHNSVRIRAASNNESMRHARSETSLSANPRRYSSPAATELKCAINTGAMHAKENIPPMANYCSVCFESSTAIAVVPCGHKCLCEECGKRLQREYKKCPICVNPMGVSCLCVGATNAGKTLLLRKLERRTNIDDTTSSVPTVGTIIYRIKLANRIVTIRELGGSVAPLWSHYYHGISKIIFVVDASNLCQISASGVLLYGILSEPSLHHAEILLVLSKMDMSYRQMRNEALLMLQIDKLKVQIPQKIVVVEFSAINGCGLEKILSWLEPDKTVTQ